MPATALSGAAARVVESDDEGMRLDVLVWARLEALPDPRSPQGRIYSLASLVSVARAKCYLAVVLGCGSFEGR